MTPDDTSEATISPEDVLDTELEVLTASVQRLAGLVESLSPDQLRQPAYPTEWKISDVLSHLGSGAVITRLRLDDDDREMQVIWDEWNAKSPDQQAADALRADRDLMGRLGALSADDRKRRFAMGPMDLDLTTFLGLRVSEHVLHTWDVAVTLDRTATLPADAAGLVVTTMAMIAGFAGKPTGSERTIRVHTSGPTRHLDVSLKPDAVALSPGDPAAAPDLEMPTEAFVRLISGRLDPDHSPAISDPESNLAELRRVFTGF
ncbi:MAG TPA: maleylpyruvate isomerase family mycothiol-dependent enzyme [Acidimicrobiales bacterium]|jgi:uncharacterized protein (TIGR03083 family)|nr:maleylpyruvate isomerase family mycothiol-dependent enzyme [Acidimicrobiales bacterium]